PQNPGPVHYAILSTSSPKSAISLRVPPRAATKRLSTSWVETSPLSIWETRATETPIRSATCSCVIPRRLRISASRQPRASSSIAATDASNACWPPAVSTARSKCPESRQRDTLLIFRLLPALGEVLAVQPFSARNRRPVPLGPLPRLVPRD